MKLGSLAIFKRRNILILTLVLVIVVGSVLVAIFTPVITTLTKALNPPEGISQPTVPSQPPESTTPPAQPPQPVEPPQSTEPLPPAEITPPEGVLSFSEKELQDRVAGLVEMANQSGEVNMEYVSARLKDDKMLISVEGEARGYQVKADDMEVRFEGKTMFATGLVTALGISLTLTTEVEIDIDGGEPSVEMKSFRLGSPLVLRMLNLSNDKIEAIINDAIKSRELNLPMDLESVRIENGKLIVVPEQE